MVVNLLKKAFAAQNGAVEGDADIKARGREPEDQLHPTGRLGGCRQVLK